MGRAIIIGDVHGCRRELSDLLDRIGPGTGDAIYFLGDLVARGPDSRGVLALYREMGARAVRGNHEQKLLDARSARSSGAPGPRLSPHHERALVELDEADWALLEAMPLHLDLPRHDLRLVHAGVIPGLPFERQDAWTLTHIRSIASDGQASDRAGRESWSARYADGPHLVFGHDSRRELQLRPWATGLDTGCVYGRSLTALVVPEGERLPPPEPRRQLLVSVRARQAYYPVSGFEAPAWTA